jgi:alpha-D-xyloside xylohydrolase
MVKPNSIIAIGGNELRPDYNYADGVVLHLFELEDGREASAVVYNTQGEPELEASAERSGSRISIQAGRDGKPWEMLLHGIDDVDAVEGASWIAEEAGVRLLPQADARRLTVVLKR